MNTYRKDVSTSGENEAVKACVREMFRLLDIVETTDDGREFHPNTLAGSCRALDAAEINNTLFAS